MAGLLGDIKNPTSYTSTAGEGFFHFLSNILNIAGVIAGIILITRLISAGYMYLSASGDPKKFQQAGDTITQSILGLVIIAGSFIIIGLISRLTGIDILTPTIYGP